MAAYNREELETIIENVVKVMAKHQMLPQNVNKHQLIKDTVDQLIKDGCGIEEQDLTNPNIQKGLILLVTRLLLDPKLKINLIKDNSTTDKHILQKEFENDFKLILTFLNEQLKLKHSPEQIDKIAQRLADYYVKQFVTLDNSNKQLIQHENIEQLIAELLYGGVDLKNGGQTLTVQKIPENFIGLINFSEGGGGLSFMSQQNTAQPGKADYSGEEAITLTRAAEMGSMIGELKEELELAGVLNEESPEDYKSPRPSPFKNHPL